MEVKRGGPSRGVRGGDLQTTHRSYQGGDLIQRQHGGIFKFIGNLLGFGPEELEQEQSGGFLGVIGKLFGLGPEELQKQMSDPVKQQMVMQRGGFPWALAGLSMLPLIMGKGDIESQMRTTREPIMQRGGLSVPPALISKGLPLLKQVGVPLAMGTLASLGDNVVDKIFGHGKPRKPVKRGPKRKGMKHRGMKHRGMKRGNERGTKRGGPRKKAATTKRKMKRNDVGRQLFDHFKSKVDIEDVGRRLVSKAKRRVSPKPMSPKPSLEVSNPFTEMIRESIKTATPSSSHIGQTFNI